MLRRYTENVYSSTTDKLRQIGFNLFLYLLQLTFSRTMACQDIASMSSTDIKSFVDSFDTVLIDCDGVLWKGNSPIENSPEMVLSWRLSFPAPFVMTQEGKKPGIVPLFFWS